eukprot:361367-Chlamydomonas_euryale.AAC.1
MGGVRRGARVLGIALRWSRSPPPFLPSPRPTAACVHGVGQRGVDSAAALEGVAMVLLPFNLAEW